MDMIIPLSVNGESDRELIEWIESEYTKLGISRSAFIRMTLNVVRLNGLRDTTTKNVNNIPSNKETKNIVDGFMNCMKK